MSEVQEKQGMGWREWLGWAALGFSIFGVLWFAIAALGSKFGLWGWQFGLGVMTIGWGPKLLMASLGLSVISLILGLTAPPRTKHVILSLAALLIGLLAFFRVAGFGAHAAALPPIHDVQTDWSSPIAFSAELMAIRKADGALNAVEDAPVIAESANSRWPGMGGRPVSEVQEEAEFDPARMEEPEDAPYPYAIETLVLEADFNAVAAEIEALMSARGWEIVTANPEAGLFEATEVSTWFGFKDDIALRLERGETGVRVDMRSVSRVGLSDLGANAKRVDAFLGDLEQVAR